MNQPFNQLINQTEQLKPLLKRLPVVLNFVLIIACAQLLSEAIWMLLADSNSEFITPATLVSSVSTKNLSDARNAQQQAFRNLSSAHLFGIAETKKLPSSTEKLPETKLNLVLRGVLAADATGMASAIIAQGANGKEEIYSIDDKIPGGITLREIHADHVILERQGRFETLRMIKEDDANQISLSRNTQTTARTSKISAASSQKLKDIRSDLIKNPASFGKYARPIIVRENGKQIGYRLQPQQNSDLLTQAGIQPSDVIISVNGNRLDNTQNSIKALKELQSAGQVTITVKRNGAEVPLNIQLQ